MNHSWFILWGASFNLSVRFWHFSLIAMVWKRSGKGSPTSSRIVLLGPLKPISCFRAIWLLVVNTSCFWTKYLMDRPSEQPAVTIFFQLTFGFLSSEGGIICKTCKHPWTSAISKIIFMTIFLYNTVHSTKRCNRKWEIEQKRSETEPTKAMLLRLWPWTSSSSWLANKCPYSCLNTTSAVKQTFGICHENITWNRIQREIWKPTAPISLCVL